MYLVNINDTEEFGVELKETSRGRWSAKTHDGVDVELELRGRDADGRFVFRIDGQDRLIKIDGDGRFALSDGIETVNVEVTSAADVVLHDLGKRTPDHRADNELKSPITGIVLEILVAPGDTVEAGQPVVVVEAMKMENALGAPRSGKVESVMIEPGKTVFVEDVLVRLEAQ